MQSQAEIIEFPKRNTDGPRFITWRYDRGEISIHVEGFDEQTDGEMLLCRCVPTGGKTLACKDERGRYVEGLRRPARTGLVTWCGGCGGDGRVRGAVLVELASSRASPVLR